MKPLLTAEWTNLVVACFEADKKILAPYIPYKTELNEWNGRYYLSLLGFMFSKPVIAGIPSPIYRRFEEVNLRFYVRYKNRDGWQNAVVFIKEIAPSPLIGYAAKFLYKENFISLPMKHQFDATDAMINTEYYWKYKNDWNYMKLISHAKPSEPEDGSLEKFIRDHFKACTRVSPTKTREFQIEHPHWNIYPGRQFDLHLDVDNIYGKEFSTCFQQKPACSFLMDGSGTNVSYPTKV